MLLVKGDEVNDRDARAHDCICVLAQKLLPHVGVQQQGMGLSVAPC